MAHYYRTLTLEDAERSFQRGMLRLAGLQAQLDTLADSGMVPSMELVADYQLAVDRLTVFAEAWGFDCAELETMIASD